MNEHSTQPPQKPPPYPLTNAQGVPPPPYSNAQGVPPPGMYVQGVPPPGMYAQGVTPPLGYIPPFGHVSAYMVCPVCKKTIRTHVEHTISTKTHLIALALCLLGCVLCSCIPYCIDSAQTAHHSCPNCSTSLGISGNEC